MWVLFPFIFLSFGLQFLALIWIKNRFLRWFPCVGMEGVLAVKMVLHLVDPPSFDILGWQAYLWLMGSVFLGGALAWGAYVWNCGKER